MKLDIRERKKNPLMKREEAMVTVDHSGKATPNRKQIIREVASAMKASPENIIIDRILTSGGRSLSEAKVFAYSRKEDIPQWRLKKMEQRIAKIKAQQKPAEAEQAATEEAPKEEKPPKEASREEAPAGESPVEDAAKEKPKEAAPEEKKEKASHEESGEERKASHEESGEEKVE